MSVSLNSEMNSDSHSFSVETNICFTFRKYKIQSFEEKFDLWPAGNDGGVTPFHFRQNLTIKRISDKNQNDLKKT